MIGTAAWAAATAGSTNVGTGGRTRVGAFASGTSSVPEAVATALLGATGVGGQTAAEGTLGTDAGGGPEGFGTAGLGAFTTLLGLGTQGTLAVAACRVASGFTVHLLARQLWELLARQLWVEGKLLP